MQTASKAPTRDRTPRNRARSSCGIHHALQVLGDRWTLLIIRDMAFENRRTFRELLENSRERIASNILADRLERMGANGLIRGTAHPFDKRQRLLRLTPSAVDLVPVLEQLGAWSHAHLGADPEACGRCILLRYGGLQFMQAYLHDLAVTHRHRYPPKLLRYGILAPRVGGPVARALEVGYEAMITHLRATATVTPPSAYWDRPTGPDRA